MITDGFRRYAAPEAIEVFLKKAVANVKLWEREVWDLAELLDERRQQIAKGEWPVQAPPSAGREEA